MSNPIHLPLRRLAWLLVLPLLAIPGCGSNELNSTTAVRLRGVANLYMDFAVTKNGQGPADEEELKKHIRNQPGFILENNAIDPKAIDTTFISERDQQPFVVRYGLKITQISGTSAPLVAHEKNGKNGMRLVSFANGKVELVDEARLKELTSPNP